MMNRLSHPTPILRGLLGTARLECHSWKPAWRKDFSRLNQDWITRHFQMEAKDQEILSDPEGTILARGGSIFFACLDGEVVGTCALMPGTDGSAEIMKFAVAPSCQGMGIGRLLIKLCEASAQTKGLFCITARTNRSLEASYHLLTTSGYRDIGEDPSGDYIRETRLLKRVLFTAGRTVQP